MYVAARSQSGEPQDLARAFDRSWGSDNQFDLNRFAREGMERIHPLWLVKGLSNNVLGLTSVALDIQGWNSNYCQGEEGSWTAIVEGAHAVSEGQGRLGPSPEARILWWALKRSWAFQPVGKVPHFLCFESGHGSGPELWLDREQNLRREGTTRCIGCGIMGSGPWRALY